MGTRVSRVALFLDVCYQGVVLMPQKLVRFMESDLAGVCRLSLKLTLLLFKDRFDHANNKCCIALPADRILSVPAELPISTET